MLDNFYDLYELKQKEYEQRIYIAKNRTYSIKKKTTRLHTHISAIVVKVKELFSHNQFNTDVTCCSVT